MDIQINIERAIHQLVDEFLDEPYRFFNEADAVSRFHHLLETDTLLHVRVKSRDGVPLSMIHQGYPTFFHYEDAAPAPGAESAAPPRRGRYDLVILSPAFVRAHKAETVRDHTQAGERVRNIQPFQAVIEFRLEDRSWSSGKTRGAALEMGKLILSHEDADLRYFVGLMRYSAPSEDRWNKYWPDVTQTAMDGMQINSLFATYRIQQPESPHVQSFGDWCTKYEEVKRLRTAK
jgi:hypothetical protein